MTICIFCRINQFKLFFITLLTAFLQFIHRVFTNTIYTIQELISSISCAILFFSQEEFAIKDIIKNKTNIYIMSTQVFGGFHKHKKGMEVL